MKIVTKLNFCEADQVLCVVSLISSSLRVEYHQLCHIWSVLYSGQPKYANPGSEQDTLTESPLWNPLA